MKCLSYSDLHLALPSKEQRTFRIPGLLYVNCQWSHFLDLLGSNQSYLSLQSKRYSTLRAMSLKSCCAAEGLPTPPMQSFEPAEPAKKE